MAQESQEFRKYTADDLVTITRSAMVELESVLESTDLLYDALSPELPMGLYEDVMNVLRHSGDLDHSLHELLMHAAWRRDDERRGVIGV